jgi:hypothetical protein
LLSQAARAADARDSLPAARDTVYDSKFPPGCEGYANPVTIGFYSGYNPATIERAANPAYTRRPTGVTVPQLISFLPCEKVIVAQDGSLSIIGVLDSITATLPTGQNTLPADTVAPMRWSMLAIYRREPGDENKRYVQRVRFVLPNGAVGGETVQEFAMTHALIRNVNGGEGFPIGIAGQCLLRLTLSEGAGREEVFFAEYPVTVVHQIGG